MASNKSRVVHSIRHGGVESRISNESSEVVPPTELQPVEEGSESSEQDAPTPDETPAPEGGEA